MLDGREIEKQRKLVRVLGIYLLLLSAYQLGFHLWPGGSPVLLDPRLGVIVPSLRVSARLGY